MLTDGYKHPCFNEEKVKVTSKWECGEHAIMFTA